jgi:hypothetical protein
VRLRRRAVGAVLRQCQVAMMVVVFALKNFAHWLPSHGLGQDALLRFFTVVRICFTLIPQPS